MNPEPKDIPHIKNPLEIVDPKELAKNVVSARAELLTAYLDIRFKATAGHAVAAEDFLKPEKKYNDALAGLGVEEHLKSQRMDIDAYQSALRMGMNELFAAQPRLQMAFDAFPIDQAFYRDRVRPAAYTENTTLDPNIQTEVGLIIDLLRKNRGIVFGDIHTQDEAPLFMEQYMTLFKAQGVDTIYVENVPDFERMNKLTSDELRILARKGEYQGIKIPDAVDTARMYNVTHADENTAAFVLMLAAAKEQDISVVDIDKQRPASELESDVSRIATTNYVWSERINNDRERRAQEGLPDGKFVAWGGMGHFISDRERGVVMTGMVDEAIGAPLLGFKPAKALAGAFEKSDNPNGPDFYLKGSKDYPEIHLLDKAINPLDGIRSGNMAFVDVKEGPLAHSHGLPSTAITSRKR
jgi:hypothetical protein